MYGFNGDRDREYVCYAIVFGEFVTIRSSTFFNGNYICLSSSIHGNSLSPVHIHKPKDIERDKHFIPLTTYIDCKNPLHGGKFREYFVACKEKDTDRMNKYMENLISLGLAESI